MNRLVFAIRTRRTKIRAAAFAFAAFVSLTAFAYQSLHRARQSEMLLNYTYQRALSELSTYVDNIDASLIKTVYSGTSASAVANAAKVWRESAAAKACLSNLPYSDIRLGNTNRFISQVGEYAYSLTNRAAAGQTVTEDERDRLMKLSGYASNLKDQLRDMLSEIAQADYSECEVMKELSKEFSGDPETGAFYKMEGSYEDYPSLIYDGPFSDHLQKGEFKALSGLNDISVTAASRIANDLLGGGALYSGKTQGTLPTYVFTRGDERLELTVKGGRALLYSNHRDIKGTDFSVGEAVEAAQAFLSEHGIGNMTHTYYLEEGDSVVVNFAFTDGGAVCYPDLIKVKIAMDDLSVIGFESAGYLSNHKKRDRPENTISEEKARESVSTYLTANSVREAYICPNGLTEYFVYEYSCTAESGREVLSYIDAVTGREVDILLLLHTPGGTLTV